MLVASGRIKHIHISENILHDDQFKDFKESRNVVS
jgi:hypothetical protein